MTEQGFKCRNCRCFGCKDGMCKVLSKPPKKRKCPFYKLNENLEAEQKRSEKRIERLYRISYTEFLKTKI